jgi:hypothetical protein
MGPKYLNSSRKQKVRNRDWKPQPEKSQFMLASAMESTSVLKTHAVLDSSDISDYYKDKFFSRDFFVFLQIRQLYSYERVQENQHS